MRLFRSFIFLLLGILLSFSVTAASYADDEELWTKTFGGSANDFGNSVQQTADGGYIIAGATSSSGEGLEDVYLIKTGADGALSWEKTFGGTFYDVGNSVQQTADGGYIVAGYTESFGAGSNDVYLIKTGADGSLLWEKTFGGSANDFGNSVQQTADGGYIIVGYTSSLGAGGSDVYLIKTGADGSLLWEKTFGGSANDFGNSVQQTADGGYIIVGKTNLLGLGSYDVYLIKTDADGGLLWENTFGGSRYDVGNSIQQTADGGYIIAGETESFGAGSDDVYLIKTDADGTSLWEETFGGSAYDFGNSVQQTADGGYIIAGYTSSSGLGSYDVYLIKTGADGSRLWEKTFGGSAYDFANPVRQTADGGYIMAGHTNSFGAGLYDVYLIYYKPAPDPIWLFVTRFYQLCLSRDPDQDGLNYWASSLADGTRTGADVAKGFILSQEFLNRNVSDEAYLEILYAAFFDRKADSGGYDFWLDQLKTNADRSAVLDGFIYSQEFANLCDEYDIIPFAAADPVQAFVTRFYQLCLGRDPDQAGLADWVNSLKDGSRTGGDVAFGFVFSQEFTNMNTSNDQYLDVLYHAFFNRNWDQGGYDYWISQLNSGASREDVLNGFTRAQEFYNLCNEYGITPN